MAEYKDGKQENSAHSPQLSDYIKIVHPKGDTWAVFKKSIMNMYGDEVDANKLADELNRKNVDTSQKYYVEKLGKSTINDSKGEQPEAETVGSEKWISVKDRLPENTKDVLCFPQKGKQFVGKYTKGHEIEFDDDDYDGDFDPIEERNGTLYLKEGWYECEEQMQSAYDEYWINRVVTHWMPLPAPPTKIEN